MKTDNVVLEWLFQRKMPDSTAARLAFAALRVVFIVVYNTYKDLIMLRAAALTYTVILSIVPLLALGTAVLKGLGAGDQMRQAAYVMIDNFEVTLNGEHAFEPALQEATEDTLAESATANATCEKNGLEDAADKSEAKKRVSATMLAHLKNAVDKVFDYVDHTNFATLGIWGVSGLLVVVLLMLDAVEEAINAIWKPERMRPLGRRLMDHAALLIILPLAVNAGFAAIAAIQSQKFMQLAMYWFPVKGFFVFVFRILPVAIVIGTFALIYRFLPNTRVEALSALAGAVVGGMIWLVVQVVYLKLQLGVARYNAIYGSFATFPLVLVWIYMGWLSFLVGAEVSFAAQAWRQFRMGGKDLVPAEMIANALDVAAAIFRAFRRGKPASAAEIARCTGLVEGDVRDMLRRLEDAEVIRRVGGEIKEDEWMVVPSGPPDLISPKEVVSLVIGQAVGETWGGRVASDGIKGARRAVAQHSWPDAC